MHDDLDIPDFLRATGPSAYRNSTPVKRVTKRTKRQRFDLPKSIEPAGFALLKQIEQQKKEKAAARFALLKEKYGTRK